MLLRPVFRVLQSFNILWMQKAVPKLEMQIQECMPAHLHANTVMIRMHAIIVNQKPSDKLIVEDCIFEMM